MARKVRSIGNYILGERIGSRKQGKVQLGTHCLTGERVAIKLHDSQDLESADVEAAAREVFVLKLLEHPHIVEFYEVLETSRKMFLVAEYASGGDLVEHVSALGSTGVGEARAREIFVQVLAALLEVHRHQVIHGNVHPAHVLLDYRGNVKLAGFGSSNVYRGTDSHPKAVDVRGLGSVLRYLLSGCLSDDADGELPENITSDARSLLDGLLMPEASDRLSLDAAQVHPWCAGYVPCSCICKSEVQAAAPDGSILDEMDRLGLVREKVLRSFEKKRHNHDTTTYKLLASKKLRRAHESSLAKKDIDADSNPPSGAPPISIPLLKLPVQASSELQLGSPLQSTPTAGGYPEFQQESFDSGVSTSFPESPSRGGSTVASSMLRTCSREPLRDRLDSGISVASSGSLALRSRPSSCTSFDSNFSVSLSRAKANFIRSLSVSSLDLPFKPLIHPRATPDITRMALRDARRASLDAMNLSARSLDQKSSSLPRSQVSKQIEHEFPMDWRPPCNSAPQASQSQRSMVCHRRSRLSRPKIMHEVQRVLHMMKIETSKHAAGNLKCWSPATNVSFHAEVASWDPNAQVNILRFQCVSGDETLYKGLCSRILRDIHI